MNSLKVKFKKVSAIKNLPIPSYTTSGSAGCDLRAAIETQRTMSPGEIALIPTGLAISLPAGYEAQVRSRSGLSLSHGVAVLNSPGTVDSDYRGELKVMLINHGAQKFYVRPLDRIAQIVFARHEKAEWVEVSELEGTERGEGGFGSTGIK